MVLTVHQVVRWFGGLELASLRAPDGNQPFKDISGYPDMLDPCAGGRYLIDAISQALASRTASHPFRAAD
jgi:hypothetical protein